MQYRDRWTVAAVCPAVSIHNNRLVIHFLIGGNLGFVYTYVTKGIPCHTGTLDSAVVMPTIKNNVRCIWKNPNLVDSFCSHGL